MVAGPCALLQLVGCLVTGVPTRLWIVARPKPSAVSVWLHWIVAGAVFVALGSAIQAVYYSPMGTMGLRRYYFLLHAYAGLLVLGLVVARLTFRALVPWPRAAERTPRILEWAGSITHWTLYALMFLIPLTGWIVASSAGCCIGVPGLPDINQLSLGTGGTAPANPVAGYSLHRVLPWALLALVLLHVAAGLFHHFIARDQTLTRMLPGPPQRRRRSVNQEQFIGPKVERQPEGGRT